MHPDRLDYYTDRSSLKPGSAVPTRRRFLQGLGAAAAIPCLGHQVAAGAQRTATDGPDAVKVLSANIRLDLEQDYETGNGWKERREMCAEILAAQNPHILCLQECYAHQLADLKQYLRRLDSFGQSKPEEFHPANAILFDRERYEMITAGGFWLSETPHVAGSVSWDSARPRFVNWIYLRDRQSGAELRVWNTHLDHVGQRARVEQAKLIVEGATPFPEEAPQILVGDFNADASNNAISAVTDRGWTDTYRAVHGPEDPGFTFHRFLGPGYAEAMQGRKIKGKIDFIFTRGNLEVLDAAVIRQGREGRYPSDHYFVSAEVRLGN